MTASQRSFAEIGPIGQPPHRVGDRCRLVRIARQLRDHELLDGGAVGANHRHAAAVGLEHRQAEALVERGIDHHLGLPCQGDEILVGDIAREHQRARPDAERGRHQLEVGDPLR